MNESPLYRALVVLACLAIVIAVAACTRIRIHGERPSPADTARPAAVTLRVATYNASLFDDAAGGLERRLRAGDAGARKVAAVLQRVRPDLLLVNEFDHDDAGASAELFQREYLERPQAGGGAALHYPHRYFAPVNTGVPSGLDLDGNGATGGAGRDGGNDAWGYGLHPGQYGMLVLSRHPIDAQAVRSFRLLKWSAMPGARRPVDPASGKDWYRPDVWTQLRLSSKSHWDVPVRTPLGVLHFLVAHPTPPVFDGPEDRNGARNHDEIRLWSEYLSHADATWLCDDRGRCGGLDPGADFVIAGDYNNDPLDGDGVHAAIQDLLAHPRVLRHRAPSSAGARAAATAWAGPPRRGTPGTATGDFGPRVGALRLDYVLPSARFVLRGSGVFWPAPDDPDAAIADGSDHRLVWIDISR